MSKVLLILILSLSSMSYSQEILSCNQLQVGYTDHNSCDFLETFNSKLRSSVKSNKKELKIIRRVDICDYTTRSVQIISDEGKTLVASKSYKILKYVDSFEGHMFVEMSDITE